MRSLCAAAIATLAVSVPAPAFDSQRDLAADSGVPAAQEKKRGKPDKVQDRIPHNVRIFFAGLPEMFTLARPSAPRGSYAWNESVDAQIARHAAANGVPVDLARRVVKRESGGNPRAVSKGNYGLMQIRLGTAQAMGYRGTAQGLLDADTNMTYAMKYLAGALRAANGNHDRAIQLYARGYYYEAKRMGFSAYEPPRAAGLAPVTATR